MAMELNEANLKEAYFKVLECTGIGAASEDILPKNVLVTVPQSMHEDFSPKLLGCAINVCANSPFEWTVDNVEPTINADTTFQSLWDDLFTVIVTG